MYENSVWDLVSLKKMVNFFESINIVYICDLSCIYKDIEIKKIVWKRNFFMIQYFFIKDDFLYKKK